MKKSFFFLISVGFGSLAAFPAQADVPTQPSIVSVSGRQLMVQKRLADGSLDAARPYIMKGVTWQPATRAPANGPNPLDLAQTVQYGFFFDYTGRVPQGDVIMDYWTRTEMAARYTTDIPLMQHMHVNTVRTFTDFGTDPAVTKRILDAFYQAGIMVVMSVVSSANDITSSRYLDTVQLMKTHPAILMWAIGNEWNLNTYYGTYANMSDAITATQAAALAIKAMDPNHPVSSNLGDIFTVNVSTNSCENGNPNSDIPTIVNAAPAVDLWGLNIYRGASFGTLFQQWKTATTKPFYFGEFGIDSFNTTAYTLPFDTSTVCGDFRAQVIAGSEDQATQSTVDIGLWREIAGQLSYDNGQNPCIGGTLFAFNDEIWEVGDYNLNLGGLVNYNGPNGIAGDGDDDASYATYNPDGFYLPASSPDHVTNEEYFGIVTADRVPKQTYYALQSYYQTLAPTQMPAISYTNPPTAAVAGLPFSLSLHGDHFASDSYVLWNGTPRTTTYVNDSELRVNVSAADLAQDGVVHLYAINPAANGAASPLFSFPIQAVNGLSAARVSPNPWRSDRHAQTPITFDQLTPASTVKIFTLSGRWVRSLAAPSGFVNWDRANDSGALVASGIYLYVVTDDQGERARGKLAIIR